jgi:nitrogenase molybdenum-iron protein alpha/beta subunit
VTITIGQPPNNVTHTRTAETIKYVWLGIENCAEIYLGPQGLLQIEAQVSGRKFAATENTKRSR